MFVLFGVIITMLFIWYLIKFSNDNRLDDVNVVGNIVTVNKDDKTKIFIVTKEINIEGNKILYCISDEKQKLITPKCYIDINKDITILNVEKDPGLDCVIIEMILFASFNDNFDYIIDKNIVTILRNMNSDPTITCAIYNNSNNDVIFNIWKQTT